MSDEDYLRGRIDERNRILALLVSDDSGMSSTCAIVATDGDRWCTLKYGHVGPHESENEYLGVVRWVRGGPVEIVKSGSGE